VLGDSVQAERRAGSGARWELHEIAAFAGHRSTQTTLQYTHLSGRDLAAKLEAGMAQIHAERIAQISEALS